MKRFTLLLLFGILGFAAARGADGTAMRVSKPAAKDAIVAVIEAQLVAFRRGEVETAYRYASEGLRGHTPLRAFGRMVQRNYPEIWQNTRAAFSVVRDDGARAMLVVHVFAQESDAAYDYILFKETAGWRVGGVFRHEARKANSL